ncbi:MAG: ATP-binding protein, partial [Planctomycetota bacterium]
DYGMSRLGRVNYRESGRNLFLGGAEGPTMRHHSEETAREIDQEVKRIIDEGIERTKVILETRRPALEAITQSLLEHEVIDADKLAEIIEENSPSPMIVPGTDAEPAPAPRSLGDENRQPPAASGNASD